MTGMTMSSWRNHTLEEMGQAVWTVLYKGCRRRMWHAFETRSAEVDVPNQWNMRKGLQPAY